MYKDFEEIAIHGIDDDTMIDIIDRACTFAKFKLFPRTERVILDIEVVDGDSNSGSSWENDDREFHIMIDKGKDFLITLFHEMIHVKQYLKRELVDLPHFQVKWKGYTYSKDYFPYENRPWEIEAYAMEEDLYNDFYLTMMNEAYQ